MVNIYIGQNIALHLYEKREILVYEKYLILQQQKKRKRVKNSNTYFTSRRPSENKKFLDFF